MRADSPLLSLNNPLITKKALVLGGEGTGLGRLGPLDSHDFCQVTDQINALAERVHALEDNATAAMKVAVVLWHPTFDRVDYNLGEYLPTFHLNLS